MDFRLNTLIAWPKEAVTPSDCGTEIPTQPHKQLDQFRIERVLYVDAPNNEVWAIDVSDRKAWPEKYDLKSLRDAVTADRARIVVGYEPYPIITLTDEELGEDFLNYITYRNEAWKLIEPLVNTEIRKVFSRRIRGQLIAEIAKKTGRAKGKIRFQLRRYFQRGCTKNALFPDWYKRGLKGTEMPGDKKRGRPTIERDENNLPVGVNATPRDIKIFKDGIRKYVTSGTSSNLSFAWQRIKEEHYTTDSFISKETEEGILLVPELLPANQIPTIDQFKYYYRKWRNPSQEIITIKGQDEYDRNVRPVLGSVFEEAPNPAALYQIDAAIGDVYLVNDFDRTRLIGRPVIYIVIDTFSRKVVGWSVTLEGPNWMGARLALEMAFEEFGYCEALIGDNGEIKGYKYSNTISLNQD